MKKKRFTQAEIIHVLEQAKAGIPVRELLRKYGISQATFYTWRKKYTGLSASEAGRLKQLEEENTKLKTVVQSCPSTSRFSRTSWQESSEACMQARARPSKHRDVRSERAQGVPAIGAAAVDASLRRTTRRR